MHQLSILGGGAEQPQPVIQSKRRSPQPQSAQRQKQPEPALQLTAPVISPLSAVQSEAQTRAAPDFITAAWGCCRLCNAPIKIPGLDHNLCSGDCGWVIDPIWLRQRSQGRK